MLAPVLRILSKGTARAWLKTRGEEETNANEQKIPDPLTDNGL